MHGFNASSGPRFVDKLEDIVGPYLFTSQNVVSFTLDGIGICRQLLNHNGCNDQVLFQHRWPQIEATICNTVLSTRTDHFPRRWHAKPDL